MTSKKIESNDQLHSSLLRNLIVGKKNKKTSGGLEEDLIGNEEGQGKVNVELSKTINSEFNPELMAAERREKVSKLKELIQSGKYNPKSEDIAAALGEEIVFEILSDRDKSVNE